MKAMRILKVLWSLALLAAFLSSSRCATTALSIRSTEGNVKVFELGQRIPRNVAILDIISTTGPRDVGPMGTEIYGGRGGCSYRQIIRYLKKRAKSEGGDAIAILKVTKPLSWNNCFEVEAFLLDTIDTNDWPRIGLTKEKITRDLDARRHAIDDIEGIWVGHARSEVMMDHAEKMAGDREASRRDPYGFRGAWRVSAAVIVKPWRSSSPKNKASVWWPSSRPPAILITPMPPTSWIPRYQNGRPVS